MGGLGDVPSAATQTSGRTGHDSRRATGTRWRQPWVITATTSRVPARIGDQRARRSTSSSSVPCASTAIPRAIGTTSQRLRRPAAAPALPSLSPTTTIRALEATVVPISRRAHGAFGVRLTATTSTTEFVTTGVTEAHCPPPLRSLQRPAAR